MFMDAPSTISRYRLTGELGRGGMGVVYRAEDPQLGRNVAVKVILFPNQASAEQRTQLERRFEREARAAAGIQHPGVITVYDFGRDGDYLFLVMELIDGQSLDQVLRQGRRPGRAAAFEIVARVADALAVAHAGGVVHRDVTPRNILIAKDGRVIVTDFGVARSFGEETVDLTHTGMLVGSPRYMAPELVRNRDFDGRADLFSLGVVLYFLLTGQQAFRGSDMTSLLYQIVHEDPLEDLDLQGSLSREVVHFLAKSLAKAPEDRFQSAEDFAAEARCLSAEAADKPELEETVDLLGSVRSGAVAGNPARSSARQPAPTEPPGWRRRPMVLLAAFLLLLLLSLAGTWVWTQWSSGVWASNRPTLEERAAGQSTPGEPASGDELPPSQGEEASGPAPTTDSSALADQMSAAALEIPVSSQPRQASTIPEPTPVRPAISAPPPERSRNEPQRSPRPVEQPGERPVEPPEEQPAEPAADTAPDTVAPVLALDPQPAQFTSSRIVLSGRVLDDRGAVELHVDGAPITVEEGGVFLTRRSLQPGRNVFTFVAVDDAGNQTMRSLEVMAPAAGGTAATADPTADAGIGNDPGPPGDPPTPPPPRPPSRFADRGDGSLIDRRTGLAWTKRLPGEMDWRAARDYCRGLDLGRADDWMLPTIEELEEYHRAGTRPMPAPGNQMAGPAPLNFPAQPVWSSSRQGFSDAWMFDLGPGTRREASRNGDQASAFCVRRTEGGEPRPRREEIFDPFGQPDPNGQPGRPDRSPPGGQQGGPQGPPGGQRGGGGERGGKQGGGRGPGGPDRGGPPPSHFVVR